MAVRGRAKDELAIPRQSPGTRTLNSQIAALRTYFGLRSTFEFVSGPSQHHPDVKYDGYAYALSASPPFRLAKHSPSFQPLRQQHFVRTSFQWSGPSPPCAMPRTTSRRCLFMFTTTLGSSFMPD
jgi:hypothetical protein